MLHVHGFNSTEWTYFWPKHSGRLGIAFFCVCACIFPPNKFAIKRYVFNIEIVKNSQNFKLRYKIRFNFIDPCYVVADSNNSKDKE